MTIAVTFGNPTSGLTLASDQPHTFTESHSFTGTPQPSGCFWDYRVAGSGSAFTRGLANSPGGTWNVPANTFPPGNWELFRRVQQDSPFDEGSATVFFTTAATPATPSFTSPASGATVETGTPLVTWSSPSGHDAYEIVVYSQAGTQVWTSGVVVSSGTSANVTLPAYESHTVQLRVRKSTIWSGYAYRVLTRIPTPPVITAPTSGATFAENTRTVTWTVTSQDSYEVRVVNGSGGVEWTTGQVNTPGTRSITASVPNVGAQTVDVRVRHNSVWSNRTSVAFTRTIPNTPVITAPANGAVFESNAQTLTWTAALQEGYEIRILNDVSAVEWTSGDVTSTVRTLGLSFPIQGVKTVDIRVRYAGVWSNRTSISVNRTAPPTPVITAPTNGATFATVAQTVNWTSSRQQVYELRILHTATGALEWTSGEVSSTALTRAISFPNLGSKTIDLRVRDESVWSPRTSVSVYVSPTPVITSLTGGVVAAANEALVGNHSTPFEGDDYQAAVKSRWRIVGAGTWTDGAAQNGSQTFYTYPSNLTVGDYERQVAVSLNATGEWSPWSASGLFTVFVRPPMPAIVVPVPNTTVADRLNVVWTAPSQDAFEIQVRNGLVVEWTSGVVVSSPLRTAEVQFPTLGERQVYLRVRNNTLWSNEGPGRSWVTLPVSVVATPVTSLDRVIDPFVATSLGYDTVNLTWTPPLAATWSGYRIVRSRSGYPTTENDGLVVHEVLGGSWDTDTGYANTDLPGGWHYYTFFLLTADGTTWVRVATTDVLVPYDYGTTDKLWDTIPDYYKHIRDDSADQSTKNLRINPELYLSNDYSAPNLLLSSFLHLFGIGLDHIRTQVENVVSGYGSNDVHVNRLNLLAKQFGRDLEQAVPAYANRTVVRNLAYLYRKRGTLDGIAELATMTTGWDVEVTLGPNMMLNEDQAALANPEYDKWDASRYYTPGIRVEYGSYIFQNILASSGAAQAPANSGVNNTWWNVVLAVTDRTLARVDTGDMSTWQASLNPGAQISGVTATGVGVQDPTDALMFQTNALEITRTGSNGATYIHFGSVPLVPAAGQTLDAKRSVLEAGIPIPPVVAHVVGKTYLAGSLVRYSTVAYEALKDTSALPTVTTDWKAVSLANAQPRLRLSAYTHGPFTGTAGTGGRVVQMLVRQYDADGTLISGATGVDVATNSGAVGAAWTRPYWTITPDANTRYIAVGGRIEAPGLNEKQYWTKWMLERPEISVSTPSTYSKAREVQVLVKADRVNLVPAPSFELGTTVGTGWSADSAGTNGTITHSIVTTPGVVVGTKSQRVQSAAMDNNANTRAGVLTGFMPLSLGATGYARANVTAVLLPAGRRARLQLNFYTSADVYISSALAERTTTGLIELTFTAPANAAKVNMTLMHRGDGTGSATPVAVETVWDAALLVEGAPLPYFDGSTTTDAVWEGTAHNSRSHYYENRVERLPALARALTDTVPIGIGVGAARFGVWTG